MLGFYKLIVPCGYKHIMLYDYKQIMLCNYKLIMLRAGEARLKPSEEAGWMAASHTQPLSGLIGSFDCENRTQIVILQEREPP